MIIVTNEKQMASVSFSMVTRVEAALGHCRRDIDCAWIRCKYEKACGRDGTCVCIGKEEATPNVKEITSQLN
jgi:hypothetical protein